MSGAYDCNYDFVDDPLSELVEAHAEIRRLEGEHAAEIARLRLTDAERDDICVWLAECLRQASTATEGCNEELAERWTGRAKRAAAMLERLGGEG